mmetsp:Transcript_20460/g.65502  ORF Transcript_20460/g.65502 Transcript_20460/m.65502 type:complete len:280 (+) Transcript_20460:1381-2220(+)
MEEEAHVKVLAMEHGVVIPQNLLAQHVSPPESDGAVAAERRPELPLELLHEPREFVLEVLQLHQLVDAAVLGGRLDDVRHRLDVLVAVERVDGHMHVLRQRHVIVHHDRVLEVDGFPSSDELGDPVLCRPVHRVALVALRDVEVLDALAPVRVVLARQLVAHLLRTIHGVSPRPVVADEDRVGREHCERGLDGVGERLLAVLGLRGAVACHQQAGLLDEARVLVADHHLRLRRVLQAVHRHLVLELLPLSDERAPGPPHGQRGEPEQAHLQRELDDDDD